MKNLYKARTHRKKNTYGENEDNEGPAPHKAVNVFDKFREFFHIHFFLSVGTCPIKIKQAVIPPEITAPEKVAHNFVCPVLLPERSAEKKYPPYTFGAPTLKKQETLQSDAL